jgi:predicted RNA-binding protein with TRAM domain
MKKMDQHQSPATPFGLISPLGVKCRIVKKAIGLYLSILLTLVNSASYARENNNGPGSNMIPVNRKDNIADQFRLKKPAMNEMGGGAAILFLENKGQVTDQDGKPRKDIQFQLKATTGLNIFVGNGAIRYQFSKCNNPESLQKDPNSKFNADSYGGTMPETLNYDMHRMDVELVGANKNAKVITEQQQAYCENYFTTGIGEKGATAHTWKRVIYKEIYQHIDWVLYIQGDKLEHEFLVHPGGRVSDIKLKYGGTTALKINSDGSLLANTPQGTVTEKAPYTYQKDGRAIASSFKLDNDVLSYMVADYTGELVVDPSIAWATYYGGSLDDRAYALATDGSGNVYITGVAVSSTGIATSGAYDVTLAVSSDAYLAKFNAAGTRQWGTYYGSNGPELASGIATNSSGDVYITGYTTSTIGMTTSGAHQATIGGPSYDAFVAKFNGSGALQWATYYGGIEDDFGTGVTVDNSGYVYITGRTESSNAIATSGAHQATFGGGTLDAFLAKFNSAGARQWATYYGGSASDEANGVATDGSGNVYITGQTASTTGIATSGAHQPAYSDSIDAFLVQFNSAGVRQWATYYGGTGDDIARGAATDGSGNVYITGQTASTTAIATSGAHQPTYGGYQIDAFLAQFNSAGVRQWATYYGAKGNDIAWGAATDGSGNVYITGQTGSTGGIATRGSYKPTYSGDVDAFLVQFNNTGVRKWGTYYGNSGSDFGKSIAVSGTDFVAISGLTQSTDIGTSGAHQESPGGGNDAFLATFSLLGFDGGSPQDLAVCLNSVNNPINSLLTITDPGVSLTETYSVTASPAHGVITTGSTAASGTSLAPTGWSYTPTSGYTGTDAFTIQVNNGAKTASSIINVTVNALPAASISYGSPALCKTGSANVTRTGQAGGTYSSASGLSINSSTGALNLAASTAGAYTVTYSFSNGTCSNTTTATVTVNALPTAAITYGTTAFCKTGSASVTQTGQTGGAYSAASGLSINSSSGAINLAVSTAGAYTVTYSFSNGTCSNITTARVTVNALPTSTATASISTITCTNLSATLTATGGGSYLWDNSTTGATRTVTAGGTYSVTVTGTNGCSASATVTVGQNTTAPTADATSSIATITCTNPSSTLTATGGGSYVWDDASTSATRSVSTSGTYSVTVTDATNGCSAATTVTVGQNTTAPTAGATPGIATITCTNPSATLTAIGGDSYIWDDASTSATRTVSTGGTYSVTVTDATNGCSAATTVSVGQNTTAPTAGATPGIATITCTNPSATLTATGGGSYLWDDASTSATRTVSTSGTYSVTVTDATNGCSAATTVTVGQNTTAPTAGATPGIATITCTNPSATLTATGGDSYIWDDASTSATRTVSSGGTYSVTVTDATNGCSTATTVSVGQNTTAPTAVATSSIATITCTNPSAILTATDGDSYVWDDASTSATRTVSTGGTYSVTVTDATNGCSAATTVTVGQSTTAPTAGATPGIATITCTNPSATLTATGGGSYLWDDASTSATRTVSTGGIYSVTVTDATNGCSAATTVSVGQNTTEPTVGSTGSSSVCPGSSVTLGGSGAVSYTWSGGITNGVAFTPTATTTYIVTGTATNGCTNTSTKTVTVLPVYTFTASAGSNGSISPSGTTNVCSGGNQTYSITASSGYHIANVLVDGISNSTAISTGSYMFTAVTATHTISATFAATSTSSLTISWSGSSPEYDAAHTCTVSACPAYGSHYFVLYGYNTSLSATASGGSGIITYHWNTGATGSPLTISTTGTATCSYSVYATDAAGGTSAVIYASVVDVRCSTPGNSTKTQMCRNGKTICVDNNAVAAQISSGATVGACGSWKQGNHGSSVDLTDVINVYPNPGEGLLNVEIPATNKSAEITIMDVTGRVIDSRSITNNEGAAIQFNLSNIAKGIYLVKVNTGGTPYITKVVVR